MSCRDIDGLSVERLVHAASFRQLFRELAFATFTSTKIAGMVPHMTTICSSCFVSICLWRNSVNPDHTLFLMVHHRQYISNLDSRTRHRRHFEPYVHSYCVPNTATHCLTTPIDNVLAYRSTVPDIPDTINILANCVLQ